MQSTKKNQFFHGVKQGFPIAIGAILTVFLTGLIF